MRPRICFTDCFNKLYGKAMFKQVFEIMSQIKRLNETSLKYFKHLLQKLQKNSVQTRRQSRMRMTQLNK